MSGKLITIWGVRVALVGGLLWNFFREVAVQMIGLCCNSGRRGW